MVTPNEPQYWLDVFRNELYKEVIPWWLQYSLDTLDGGFFNCIHEDGTLYDTTKYIWLQGRQVWMFAKIYGDKDFDCDLLKMKNSQSPVTRDHLLEIAISGANFLVENAIRKEDSHVWFCLSKSGAAIQMQRKPWGACFIVMGLIELAKVMPPGMEKEASFFCNTALDLFRKILEWFANPSMLGSKYGPGQVETSSLAVPMILLNLCYEIREMTKDVDSNTTASRQYTTKKVNSELVDICNQREGWCIEEIKKHIKFEAGRVSKVLETVGKDGEEINNPSGRLINPGHVIEAGWFLMQYSQAQESQQLKSSTDIFQLGKSIATWALDIGWDGKHGGGILYFLDCSQKFSPIELEWDHKLWWPHTEALIAFLMAYEKTGEEEMWTRFQMVAEYTMSHFKDQKRGGEWYGYLSRKGKVTHNFKGGPYKGCFHVPRSLWMCVKILEGMCQKK